MDDILRRIGDHIGVDQPRSLLPSGSDWSCVEDAEGRVVVRVEMDAGLLDGDIQADGPSSPSRALCFAAWLTELGTPARAEVVVHGRPAEDNQLVRRSLFLLNEYERLLPDLFGYSCDAAWAWPPSPVFNVEGRRDPSRAPAGGERRVVWDLINSPTAVTELTRLFGPIETPQDQLPVGLFQGKVSAPTAWTPGGGCAADMWTVTHDGRDLHLFEVKLRGNEPLGVLPEAFYYTRLLAYVRDDAEIRFRPSGVGMNAARACARVFMWLSAPKLHPLVFHPEHGSPPLRRLGEALAPRQVQLGVLPLRQGADLGFAVDRCWAPNDAMPLPSRLPSVEADRETEVIG